MVLGMLGLVAFWGTMAVTFVVVWRYLRASAQESHAAGSVAAYTTAARIAKWGAVTAYGLGLAVIFKAPRGERRAGLILNGLPLLLFLGAAILVLLWRR
jgi:hypothetical protein